MLITMAMVALVFVAWRSQDSQKVGIRVLRLLVLHCFLGHLFPKRSDQFCFLGGSFLLPQGTGRRSLDGVAKAWLARVIRIRCAALSQAQAHKSGNSSSRKLHDGLDLSLLFTLRFLPSCGNMMDGISGNL